MTPGSASPGRAVSDALPALLGPTLARGARWSVQLRRARTDDATADGHVLAEHGSADLLPTASVAKIFLLAEVAARIEDGLLDAAEPQDRDRVAPVGDSGLWQHLRIARLPAADVAALIGAVSDNLATNVLLDRVGLDAVRRRAEQLAPGGSALLDRVRDVRAPEDPPLISRGCADDWSRILLALGEGRVLGPAVSSRVLGWLSLGTDLSMAAGAFGLDPLAHTAPDRGLRVVSKTGTDAGVRADVGLAEGPAGTVAYAAICWWDEDASDLREEVLDAMRGAGSLVRAVVSP